MPTCDAVTAAGTSCKLSVVGEAGGYSYCRLKSHKAQIEALAAELTVEPEGSEESPVPEEATFAPPEPETTEDEPADEPADVEPEPEPEPAPTPRDVARAAAAAAAAALAAKACPSCGPKWGRLVFMSVVSAEPGTPVRCERCAQHYTL